MDWSGRIAAVEAGGEHHYELKTLGKDRVEGMMGQTLVMNATGLERYGRCPFAWFASVRAEACAPGNGLP